MQCDVLLDCLTASTARLPASCPPAACLPACLPPCRRCKLCDMLRAQAYGLGHSNWMLRKCSVCFSHQATQQAQRRHHHPAAAAAEQLQPPLQPSVAAGRSRRLFPGQEADVAEVVAALRDHDADALLRLLGPGALGELLGVELGGDGDAELQQGGGWEQGQVRGGGPRPKEERVGAGGRAR